MNTRAIAAKLLHAVIYQKQSLTAVLTKQSVANSADAALIKAFCYGTLRWYHQLDVLLNELLHSPLANKHGDIRCLLLLGLHQLLKMQAPSYAVVSETVTAAKTFRKPWAAGLVNKLLRRCVQEQDVLLAKVQQNVVAKYAHPHWLIDHIRTAWPEHWQTILEANNTQAPMTLRVNQQRYSREQYRNLLWQHHIEAMDIPLLHHALQLKSAVAVNALPGFSQGDVSVQDAAGQMVIQLLELKPKQTVLDACAAPGSKTGYIIEQQPDLAKLIALDHDATRLQKISDNLQRLGIAFSNNHIKLIAADAGNTNTWWDGVLFDRILLDAPCSATGVIRRHPDIKLLRQAKDIAQQAHTQFTLLTALWPLLKAGGKLVYTTCSVLPIENEQLITRFLSQHKDAQTVPILENWGIELAVGRQLLPKIDGPDGFFYAVLKKSV